MEITAKKMQSLFNAMEAVGAKEIMFSIKKQSQLKKDIDDWFYKRSHHNKFYVWGESSFSKWSYVTQGKEEGYSNQLRISFLDYI